MIMKVGGGNAPPFGSSGGDCPSPPPVETPPEKEGESREDKVKGD